MGSQEVEAAKEEQREPSVHEATEEAATLKMFWATEAMKLDKAWKTFEEKQREQAHARLAEEHTLKRQDGVIRALKERQAALKEREAQDRAGAEQRASERKGRRHQASSKLAECGIEGVASH